MIYALSSSQLEKHFEKQKGLHKPKEGYDFILVLSLFHSELRGSFASVFYMSLKDLVRTFSVLPPTLQPLKQPYNTSPEASSEPSRNGVLSSEGYRWEGGLPGDCSSRGKAHLASPSQDSPRFHFLRH